MSDNRKMEMLTGSIDKFAYGGYDVVQQQRLAPVAEDRKLHRKRWYLYQYGKYVGQSFKTDKEAMAWIDKNMWNN